MLTKDIKKLSDIAYKNHLARNPNSSFGRRTDYDKEFAELIVKECVQSIEKTIETNCDTDSEKMGCEFAITDLLEHFGVEE